MFPSRQCLRKALPVRQSFKVFDGKSRHPIFDLLVGPISVCPTNVREEFQSRSLRPETLFSDPHCLIRKIVLETLFVATKCFFWDLFFREVVYAVFPYRVLI